jgi:hypothetical protein
MVATLLRAELAAAQWFRCRTNAGPVVQGRAGDDPRNFARNTEDTEAQKYIRNSVSMEFRGHPTPEGNGCLKVLSVKLMISIGFKTFIQKWLPQLLRAELAAAQWFRCRTNAGDVVVQGGAGDDLRSFARNTEDTEAQKYIQNSVSMEFRGPTPNSGGLWLPQSSRLS